MDHRPIIFLAFANDPHHPVPEVVRESSAIQKALEVAAAKGLCELVVRESLEVAEVLDTFEKPQYRGRIAVFHYAGHANPEALWLSQADGSMQAAYKEGLAAFLGRQKGLQLVFLNACSTQDHVRLLLESGVPAVIATHQEIDDELAREFAAQFYKSLGHQQSIQESYLTAVNAGQTRVPSPAQAYRHRASRDVVPGAKPPVSEEWPWALHPASVPSLNWRLQRRFPIRLVAGLSLLLLTTALAWVFFPRGGPMRGDFNVAVASFLPGADGQWLGQRIVEDLKTKEEGVKLEVRHLGGFLPEVGDEQLQTKLSRQAAQHNADLLVYGQGPISSTVARLTLQLFMPSPIPGAQDLSGSQRFSQIDLRLPITTNLVNRTDALSKTTERIKTLAEFVLALTRLEAGLRDDAPSAYRAMVDDMKSLSSNTSLKEQDSTVFRLWMAVALGELASRGVPLNGFVCPMEGEHLSKEEGQAFSGYRACAARVLNRLLVLDKEFARAHLIKGNLWLGLAYQREKNRVDCTASAYKLADAEYNQAVRLSKNDSLTRTKAYFNRGTNFVNAHILYRTRLAQVCPGVDQRFPAEDANGYLSQVIRAFEHSPHDALLRELAARSQYQLGRLDWHQDQKDQAEKAWLEVLPLAQGVPEDWTQIEWNARDQLGRLYLERRDWTKAQAQFQALARAAAEGRFMPKEIVASGHYRLGLTLEGLNDCRSALASYRAVKPQDLPANERQDLTDRIARLEARAECR